MADRNALKRAMETALAANFDDLATHMAYADLLTEMGDPRGEFIQVQLALEDPTRPAKERQDLQRREKALLDAHQREWLGEIAELLLAAQGASYKRANGLFGLHSIYPGYAYDFRRGWLDAVLLGNFNSAIATALVDAPAARLLHTLSLDENDDEGPGYEALGRAPFLACLRRFQVGPETPNCHATGEGLTPLLRQMPRLEELRLYAHGVEMAQVFVLPMPNLRLLHVYHVNTEYPFDLLAGNASLGNLVELSFWPHALEPGDHQAYIQPGPFRSLCFSPHLKGLTHLAVQMSDIGDDGARALVESGMLRRLRVLDLANGCITDAGAAVLAATPDLRRLERLTITGNMLTEAGIAALQATGVPLTASQQYDPETAMDEREYLWEGDCE